ncbi:helix-turn-helix domain-containing protein [Patescibacteria group bacterium]|nr:helix-turn-helix domain-containing protein [Patescibacteria group bacterium]
MAKKDTGTLDARAAEADGDLKKYIGRQIASIRKGSDLTARQVAEKLKVKRETLTQIETGRNNPTALMLWKLACLFQCEVSDLFPQVPEGFGLTTYTKSDMRRIKKVDPRAVEWAGRMFGEPKK